VCAGNVPSQKLHAHFVRVSSKVVVYSVRKGKKNEKNSKLFFSSLEFSQQQEEGKTNSFFFFQDFLGF
jgi:hypothetical protein